MTNKPKYLLLAKDGFPLETIMGRPITNFIRRLLLTRGIEKTDSYEKRTGIKVSFEKRYRYPIITKIKLFKRKWKYRIKKFLKNLGKGDIHHHSGKIVKKVREKINNTPDFWTGHIEVMPEGKTWIRMNGQIVITTDLGSHLWQRIKIESYKENVNAKELLIKLLKQSGLKKFHDEDGCNGIFRKHGKDKYGYYEDQCYCYVNPFFKKGYWENHTLETNFIDR